MNPNPNQASGAEAMLNADFSMTNIQEVKEDIARDTAKVVPPTPQDALQPGFAGTKASKVREQIQQDLLKARAKRLH